MISTEVCNFLFQCLFVRIALGVETARDRHSVARTTTLPAEWTVSLSPLSLRGGENHKEEEREASISSAV